MLLPAPPEVEVTHGTYLKQPASLLLLLLPAQAAGLLQLPHRAALRSLLSSACASE